MLTMTMLIIMMMAKDDNDDDNADNDDDENGDQGASGRRHSELEAVANHKHWRQEFHVVNR